MSEEKYAGDEDFAKLTAAIDQTQEGVRLITPLVWAYFESLLKTGFTRQEALILTASFQQGILPNNNKS